MKKESVHDHVQKDFQEIDKSKEVAGRNLGVETSESDNVAKQNKELFDKLEQSTEHKRLREARDELKKDFDQLSETIELSKQQHESVKDERDAKSQLKKLRSSRRELRAAIDKLRDKTATLRAQVATKMEKLPPESEKKKSAGEDVVAPLKELPGNPDKIRRKDAQAALDLLKVIMRELKVHNESGTNIGTVDELLTKGRDFQLGATKIITVDKNVLSDTRRTLHEKLEKEFPVYVKRVCSVLGVTEESLLQMVKEKKDTNVPSASATLATEQPQIDDPLAPTAVESQNITSEPQTVGDALEISSDGETISLGQRSLRVGHKYTYSPSSGKKRGDEKDVVVDSLSEDKRYVILRDIAFSDREITLPIDQVEKITSDSLGEYTSAREALPDVDNSGGSPKKEEPTINPEFLKGLEGKTATAYTFWEKSKSYNQEMRLPFGLGTVDRKTGRVAWGPGGTEDVQLQVSGLSEAHITNPKFSPNEKEVSFRIHYLPEGANKLKQGYRLNVVFDYDPNAEGKDRFNWDNGTVHLSLTEPGRRDPIWSENTEGSKGISTALNEAQYQIVQHFSAHKKEVLDSISTLDNREAKETVRTGETVYLDVLPNIDIGNLPKDTKRKISKYLPVKVVSVYPNGDIKIARADNHQEVYWPSSSDALKARGIKISSLQGGVMRIGKEHVKTYLNEEEKKFMQDSGIRWSSESGSSHLTEEQAAESEAEEYGLELPNIVEEEADEEEISPEEERKALAWFNEHVTVQKEDTDEVLLLFDGEEYDVDELFTVLDADDDAPWMELIPEDLDQDVLVEMFADWVKGKQLYMKKEEQQPSPPEPTEAGTSPETATKEDQEGNALEEEIRGKNWDDLDEETQNKILDDLRKQLGDAIVGKTVKQISEELAEKIAAQFGKLLGDIKQMVDDVILRIGEGLSQASTQEQATTNEESEPPEISEEEQAALDEIIIEEPQTFEDEIGEILDQLQEQADAADEQLLELDFERIKNIKETFDELKKFADKVTKARKQYQLAQKKHDALQKFGLKSVFARTELKEKREDAEAVLEQRRQEYEQALQAWEQKKREMNQAATTIELGALEEYGITPEQLESIPEFALLSEGQRLLVLENLKQWIASQIKDEGLSAFNKQQAKKSDSDSVLEKIKHKGKQLWRGAWRTIYIGKNEREAAQKIAKRGMDDMQAFIVQLCEQVHDSGRSAEVRDGGKIQLNYVSLEGELSTRERAAVEGFNSVATMLSRIPNDNNKAFGKDQQRAVEALQSQYQDARAELLHVLSVREGGSAEQAILQISDLDRKVRMDRFLNTTPDVDKTLKNATESSWAKRTMGFAKSIAAERGGYFAGGFIARTITVSKLGLIGAPVAAAGIGAMSARSRTYNKLREQIFLSQRSENEKLGGKEAELVQSANTEAYILRMNSLIEQLQAAEDPEKQKVLRGRLKQRITHLDELMDKGLLRVGTDNKSASTNSYELIDVMGRAEAAIAGGEAQMKARVQQIINNLGRDKRKQVKKHVYVQMAKGAGLAAGAAAAGWLARDLISGDGLDETAKELEKYGIVANENGELVCAPLPESQDVAGAAVESTPSAPIETIHEGEGFSHAILRSIEHKRDLITQFVDAHQSSNNPSLEKLEKLIADRGGVAKLSQKDLALVSGYIADVQYNALDDKFQTILGVNEGERWGLEWDAEHGEFALRDMSGSGVETTTLPAAELSDASYTPEKPITAGSFVEKSPTTNNTDLDIDPAVKRVTEGSGTAFFELPAKLSSITSDGKIPLTPKSTGFSEAWLDTKNNAFVVINGKTVTNWDVVRTPSGDVALHAPSEGSLRWQIDATPKEIKVPSESVESFVPRNNGFELTFADGRMMEGMVQDGNGNFVPYAGKANDYSSFKYYSTSPESAAHKPFAGAETGGPAPKAAPAAVEAASKATLPEPKVETPAPKADVAGQVELTGEPLKAFRTLTENVYGDVLQDALGNVKYGGETAAAIADSIDKVKNVLDNPNIQVPKEIYDSAAAGNVDSPLFRGALVNFLRGEGAIGQDTTLLLQGLEPNVPAKVAEDGSALLIRDGGNVHYLVAGEGVKYDVNASGQVVTIENGGSPKPFAFNTPDIPSS